MGAGPAAPLVPTARQNPGGCSQKEVAHPLGSKGGGVVGEGAIGPRLLPNATVFPMGSRTDHRRVRDFLWLAAWCSLLPLGCISSRT